MQSHPMSHSQSERHLEVSRSNWNSRRVPKCRQGSGAAQSETGVDDNGQAVPGNGPLDLDLSLCETGKEENKTRNCLKT